MSGRLRGPGAGVAGGDASGTGVDPARVVALTEREEAVFAARHQRCGALHERARASMPGGVPMSWMAKWAGPFPLSVATASGSRFTCADGVEFVDLCLGDTGAMTGHSPPAAVAAVARQAARGITLMLPTEDAAVVAEELTSRFGLPQWQFTLSATDANRHVVRYARHLTGRPRVLVADACYHGSVDETFATLDREGRVVPRRGNIGPPVPPSATTSVVQFNDVAAVERELSTGEIACVLMEPAMTNVGIVLPEPGYHEALRSLTEQHGTVLVLDETHTLCAGPGGMTAADRLRPDVVTLGKALGSGVPCGAFGMTAEVADRVRRSVELEDVDVGGVGGTLAGNALSLAAMRATLQQVLTPDAFAGMLPLGARWAEGVAGVLADQQVPWHVTRLGARAEYAFAPVPPRTGREAAAADDFPLQTLLHLSALNAGILLTPFHNMALLAPTTTAEDVDRHTAAFAAVLEELVA
ncbi:transaminase [Blastococcus sp. BMG 814]|uniref:Transaminase n=2 Tax=Blastococcus carthaginiensis TaxID=3050034 RepID=A0ABT9IBL7_9ACTN|nr:transaminase [Blastococcus carthaginiensis]